MDYYRMLQVDRRAEPEVIEKAYRALSMKYHPDRVPAGRRERATTRMQAINEAYAVLCDPVRRQRYDATLPASSDDGGEAWERFLDVGLAGLFVDWLEKRV
jgi:DnaJ-class molecular chaperone